MKNDIRELLKDFKEASIIPTKNHEAKMQQKLTKELHSVASNKTIFRRLSVAASIVILISLGISYSLIDTIGDNNQNIDNQNIKEIKNISLGTVSPELHTLETYYTNAINYEISQLEITDENKEMLDEYLFKIGELTKEYKTLSKDLNKQINTVTIEALIRNLQLRLQLLLRLKKQLNDLKQLNASDYENQII